MLPLAERMQALKERHDTNVTSEDKTPTPLWVLLYIYNSCTHDCYPEYMEGAKELIRYLSPIEIPVLPLIELPLPRVLISYELTELATLLAPTLSVNNINDSLLKIRMWELAIIQETLAIS